MDCCRYHTSITGECIRGIKGMVNVKVKQKYQEKNPSQCHCFLRKYHVSCHETKSDHLRLEASDELPAVDTRLHGALA